MTIHFISGPARVGKSHLYRSLHRAFEGDCVELDPLLTALISFLKPDPSHPIMNPFALQPGQPFDEWLSKLIEKDEAWWPFLKEWVEEYHQYGKDFLLVGIVWPHLLKELDLPHRAVFIVDTDELHVERLVAIAQQESQLNNWQRGWDETEVRRWAEFNRLRALHFKEQAEIHGYPVFDVAQHGYEGSQALAAAALLQRRH